MFSQQIKALRKEYKMSQAELAKQLKVTQQAIGKWETGKSTPDSDTLQKLAEMSNNPVFSLTFFFILEKQLFSHEKILFVLI